jgi:signal transduction histidine kinase
LAVASFTLSPIALALLALFCGFWLSVALWASWRGLGKAADGGVARRSHERDALLASSPAIPLLVGRDGRIDAPERLFGLLGLEGSQSHLADLSMDGEGLGGEDLAALTAHVARSASAATRFSMAVRPQESSRILLIEGGPAPAPYPPQSVLLWCTDATASEEEMARLREELEVSNSARDVLTDLIEAAPFPMWLRGEDLRLSRANSAYARAVEASDGEAAVKSGIELIDESGKGSIAAQAQAVREAGESTVRTVPATISGERRAMRVVEVPLANGGIAGYAIDINDLEQARAELARFARAQRDLLDRLSASVAQFAADRSLIFFNQPFARLFALTGDFLADNPEFDRVVDAMRESGNLPEVRDFPEWKEERRQWFTSRLAADEEDWLLPGGRHLRVVAQPLPDGGLVLIFEDRTEQLQLASARDTLLRVRTATFDNLFEAVGVFASDGRLQIWNNRFQELWRLDEEKLAAHPRIDLLTTQISRDLKNPAHASLLRELIRSATIERKQRGGRLSLTDGRDFRFAAVPLPDGNALFTMLDITDSKRVEAALRDRNVALEEADRLKTAFVSNMSYELRTPLTSISGFAEMLAGGYAGALPPAAVEYVSAINQSVERLAGLIDNVLDLTQSDSGSLMLAEEEVDLGTLCREIALPLSATAERKEIDFAIDVGPGAGAITGDRKRLGQALDNILRNAFAYTADGGRVLLRAEGDTETALITVADNGRGIAITDQTRVFDRFARAEEGREEASVGLGLPLAKQFVEAHGGSIALESEPGEGTTVTIRLPRLPQ